MEIGIMKLITGSLIFIALLLSGCVTSGPTKPDDPYKVDNASAFKGKQKVAIGSFKISFVTFDKSSSKATGGMISSGSEYAKATLRAKLEGVDDKTFQKITDQAYQDFTNKLKQNGYTVIDRSAITNAKSYANMETVPNPHKQQESSFKSVTGGSRREATFSPTGLQLYHASSMGAAPRPVPHLIYSVAAEAGVPILNVHMRVHFAYFKGQTKNGDDKKATVNLGQVIRTEDGSRVTLAAGPKSTFSNPNGTIQLTWGKSTSTPYGVTKDATSSAQKAANTFSSVVGMFSGGSSSAKELIITADPEKYSTASLDVIGRTNNGFIHKMAKLR